MILERKVHIEFDDSEQRVVNDFLELLDKFSYEDVCEHLSCYNCPLERLCDNSLKDAESFINYLNENFDT